MKRKDFIKAMDKLIEDLESGRNARGVCSGIDSLWLTGIVCPVQAALQMRRKFVEVISPISPDPHSFYYLERTIMLEDRRGEEQLINNSIGYRISMIDFFKHWALEFKWYKEF